MAVRKDGRAAAFNAAQTTARADEGTDSLPHHPAVMASKSLTRLPTEILLHIIAHIYSHHAKIEEGAPVTLLSLSRTCKALHEFVQVHGWKAWLEANKQPRRIGTRSGGKEDGAGRFSDLAKRQYLNDQAWKLHRVIGHQTPFNHIPPSHAFNSSTSHPPHRGGPKTHADEALEPFLQLGTDWLLLCVRNEVRVWHAAYLQSHVRWRPEARDGKDAPQGIKMTDAQVVRLPSSQAASTRALAPPAQRRAVSSIELGKYVSACCLLDATGNSFLVGRMDGSIAQFKLPSSLSTTAGSAKGGHGGVKREKEAPWQRYAPTRLTFEADLVAEISPPATATASSNKTQSIQALSYSNGFLCSITRSGRIALYRSSSGLAGSDHSGEQGWKLEWAFEMGRQCWSCHLDHQGTDVDSESKVVSPPRWLAIGSTGTEALFLFPLQLAHENGDSKLVPSQPIILNSLYHPLSSLPSPSNQQQPWQTIWKGKKGQGGRASSVFALAQPTSSCSDPLHPDLLVAGFYDGVIRVYDTGVMSRELSRLEPMASLLDEPAQMDDEASPASTSHLLFPSDSTFRSSSSSPTSHPLTEHLTLSPCMHFRDRFDTSAIYSLAIGGGNGTHVLAGTATSSNIKFFDARSAHLTLGDGRQESRRMIDQEEQERASSETAATSDNAIPSAALPPGSRVGWSVFAGYPARSPTFSLVADNDFVIAGTDRKLVDLVFTTAEIDRKGQVERNEEGEVSKSKAASQRSVAFYTLETMLLEHGLP